MPCWHASAPGSPRWSRSPAPSRHPCPCGNPLPAIRVQGRAGDVLTFPAADGTRIAVAPLTFATLADRMPGIDRIQLVQSAPATLRVRLRPASGAESDHVWQAVRVGLTRLLAEQGLDNVTLELAEEPPQQSSGGKSAQPSRSDSQPVRHPAGRAPQE
jgi:phenylacetate-CoA ligase